MMMKYEILGLMVPCKLDRGWTWMNNNGHFMLLQGFMGNWWNLCVERNIGMLNGEATIVSCSFPLPWASFEKHLPSGKLT